MKKYLLSLLTIIALTVSAAPTAALTLAWDENVPQDGVVKYTLYQATGLTGTFAPIADIPYGTTQYTVPGLVPGVYMFFVTASNYWGLESDHSNTVTTTDGHPPTAPRILVIKITGP